MGAQFKETNDFSLLKLDQEAVQEFQNEVERKRKKFSSRREWLHWMIENDYYINFMEKYPESFVLEMFSREAPGFQSYMAISKFYRDYALKTNDKSEYLETYAERI